MCRPTPQERLEEPEPSQTLNAAAVRAGLALHAYAEADRAAWDSARRQAESRVARLPPLPLLGQTLGNLVGNDLIAPVLPLLDAVDSEARVRVREGLVVANTWAIAFPPFGDPSSLLTRNFALGFVDGVIDGIRRLIPHIRDTHGGPMAVFNIAIAAASPVTPIVQIWFSVGVLKGTLEQFVRDVVDLFTAIRDVSVQISRYYSHPDELANDLFIAMARALETMTQARSDPSRFAREIGAGLGAQMAGEFVDAIYPDAAGAPGREVYGDLVASALGELRTWHGQLIARHLEPHLRGVFRGLASATDPGHAAGLPLVPYTFGCYLGPFLFDVGLLLIEIFVPGAQIGLLFQGLLRSPRIVTILAALRRIPGLGRIPFPDELIARYRTIQNAVDAAIPDDAPDAPDVPDVPPAPDVPHAPDAPSGDAPDLPDSPAQQAPGDADVPDVALTPNIVRRRTRILNAIRANRTFQRFAQTIEDAFNRVPWGQIETLARNSVAAYNAGGRRRAGALHRLKGILQEIVLRSLPWHRYRNERALRVLRRLNTADEYLDQVEFVTEIGDPRFLTDGMWIARTADGNGILVLDIYEVKSANWERLIGGPRAQIRRDIDRLLDNEITIEGRTYRYPDTLHMLDRFGQKQHWTLSFPREFENDPDVLTALRQRSHESAARLPGDFSVANSALPNDVAYRLAEFLILRYRGNQQ